jgi:hypothetical protein
VAKAKWAAGTVAKKTDKEGGFTISLPVTDDGQRLGVLTVTLSPTRQLRFDWKQDDGVVPVVTLAEAWSNT